MARFGFWVGVVVLGACRSEADEAPYMPPTFPPPPPPETRMDAVSGAILAKPAASWGWLEGEGLRARGPSAVLGLVRDGRCEGWVEVTNKLEPGPRAAAQRALEARRTEAGWEVQVDEDALYASHTARRWEIQRRDGDTVVSERASFLVEGPRLFALHAVARDPEYTRRRRCLDAVTAAFDVMPWEPPAPPVEDAGGPGEPDGRELGD